MSKIAVHSAGHAVPVNDSDPTLEPGNLLPDQSREEARFKVSRGANPKYNHRIRTRPANEDIG